VTVAGDETRYVLRAVPWSVVVELGRLGVAAYVLDDVPTPDAFEGGADPTCRVFIPESDVAALDTIGRPR